MVGLIAAISRPTGHAVLHLTSYTCLRTVSTCSCTPTAEVTFSAHELTCTLDVFDMYFIVLDMYLIVFDMYFIVFDMYSTIAYMHNMQDHTRNYLQLAASCSHGRVCNLLPLYTIYASSPLLLCMIVFNVFVYRCILQVSSLLNRPITATQHI